jgi:hypothetical protein
MRGSKSSAPAPCSAAVVMWWLVEWGGGGVQHACSDGHSLAAEVWCALRNARSNGQALTAGPPPAPVETKPHAYRVNLFWREGCVGLPALVDAALQLLSVVASHGLRGGQGRGGAQCVHCGVAVRPMRRWRRVDGWVGRLCVVVVEAAQQGVGPGASSGCSAALLAGGSSNVSPGQQGQTPLARASRSHVLLWVLEAAGHVAGGGLHHASSAGRGEHATGAEAGGGGAGRGKHHGGCVFV